MGDFEDDNDAEINRPLDVCFVILGLKMLILSLTAVVFIENTWAKYFGLFCFFASFFIMTKKAKEINS